jgi:hypothetical protein
MSDAGFARSLESAEGVDNEQTVKALAILEVFREQLPGTSTWTT